MKVLHLVYTTNPGGITRLLIDLMMMLRMKDVHQSLAYTLQSGPISDSVASSSESVIFCPLRYTFEWKGSYRISKYIRESARLFFVFHLIAALRRIQPDILHSHIHGSHWLSQIIAARICRVPMALHLHSPSSTYVQLRYNVWLWSHLLRCYDRVIVISNGVYRAYEHALSHIRSQNIVVRMPQGLLPIQNSERRQTKDTMAMTTRYPGMTVLGAVSRIVPEKNFSSLVRVASSLITSGINVGIILIGDGGSRTAVEALAHEKGISDRVMIVGYVDDPHAWLHLLDVYVLPSAREGLPISIVEAMRAGMPIVASCVSGTEDVITHEYNGLLFEYDDDEDMKQAILRIIIDKELAKQLSTNALRTFQCNHDMTRIASQYSTLYASMHEAAEYNA